MTLVTDFYPLKITKRILFFKVVNISITQERQKEWADDLILHNGVSEQDAITAIRFVVGKLQIILEKI